MLAVSILAQVAAAHDRRARAAGGCGRNGRSRSRTKLRLRASKSGSITAAFLPFASDTHANPAQNPDFLLPLAALALAMPLRAERRNGPR
jgi:hypothetical protein